MPQKSELTPEQTAKRRDDAVRKALNTPPKPLKDMKAAKSAKKKRPTRPERRA